MASNWWEPHKPFSTSTQKYIIKITKATVAKKRRCNGYKPQLKFSNKTFSSKNTLLLIFHAEFIDEYWRISHYQYYNQGVITPCHYQVKKQIYTCKRPCVCTSSNSRYLYIVDFSLIGTCGHFFNFCRKTVWMHNMHPSCWLRYPEAWKTPDDLSQTQLRT